MDQLSIIESKLDVCNFKLLPTLMWLIFLHDFVELLIQVSVLILFEDAYLLPELVYVHVHLSYHSALPLNLHFLWNLLHQEHLKSEGYWAVVSFYHVPVLYFEVLQLSFGDHKLDCIVVCLYRLDIISQFGYSWAISNVEEENTENCCDEA